MRNLLLVPFFILSSLLPTFLCAAPCDTNFTSEGASFFGEKTFKTFAELPSVKIENAYEGALSKIAKDPDLQILIQDKSRGVIQAVNAKSYKQGRTMPININVEKIENGSKVNITYITLAGALTPEGAVKTYFCEIVDAAVSAPSKAVEKQSEVAPLNSEFSKNGFPCVAEICLGDGLTELRKIKWDKVKTEAVSDDALSRIKKNYRGNLTASTPYLVGSFSTSSLNRIYKFDNLALAKFGDVIADCGLDNLNSNFIGKFTTPSGNPTEVEIALIPSLDNNEQIWTVVSIQRGFPKVITKQQREEIKAQLDFRYESFNEKKHKRERTPTRPEDGDLEYRGDGSGLNLFTIWPHLTERLQLYPKCALSKVNID